MRKRDLAKVAAYAAIFGLVGGVTFQGVNYTANKLTGRGQTAIEQPTKTQEDKISVTQTVDGEDEEETGGVSEVAANVLPSIVAIDVTVEQKTQDIFGRSYSQEGKGSGSGIVIAQDNDNLYIATNNHVVADAKSVSVTFQDDSVYTATVKGTDSDADLAVVEIAAKDLSDDTKQHIKVATLGDSTSVKIGEQAIAIGNALGYGTSVTVGYISAVDRKVASEDVNMKLLQTDAAINPGNSGGALIDSEGKVIGINSAKYSDTTVEGMGFAIPISTAIPIINEIVDSEQVPADQQAYLGIRGQDVSGELSEYYNIPEGIYVGEVTEGAPAAKAGMKKGDVIVSFNGNGVTTMDGLQEKLGRCKAGDKVSVEVKRADNGEYKSIKLSVTLGKKSESGQSENQQNGDNTQGQDGSGNEDRPEQNDGEENGNGQYGNGSGENGYNGFGGFGGFGNFFN